jgi:hypothetical protein
MTLASRRQQRRGWHDSQTSAATERPFTVLAEWYYAGTSDPPDPAGP